MSVRTKLCAVLAFTALAGSADAEDPFTVEATITDASGTQTASADFSSIKSFINYFNSTSISATFPSFANGYTNGMASLSGQVTYLGVPATISLPPISNGVASAILTVPGSNLTITGTGSNRNAAVSQLQSQLTGNGGALLNQLQQYLSEASPVSPLAGNPASLQSQLSDAAFSNSAFDTSNNETADTVTGSRFGIGIVGTELDTEGFHGSVYTIPLNYSYRFTKSGWALLLNMPLTYQRLDGGASYQFQAGAGLQIPLLPEWYVTPMYNVGAVASLDFASAGAMQSFTVASRYTYRATPVLDLTMGDMVGITRTLNVKVDNYSIDPKISETVVKNGLLAECVTPYHFWGQPVSVRASYAYTQYFGTKLFMNGYSEIFADIGAATSSQAAFYKRIRLGLQITLGKQYTSITGGLGDAF